MVLAALLGTFLLQVGPSPKTPNVLVIVLDDVGASERALMPALADVAAVGLEFTRFYAWPVCSPTRYAALSGRYPRRAGIGDVINAHNSSTGASPPPDRRDVLLPEALKPTHRTALVGKWHLGRASVGQRDDLLAVTESGPFVSGFDDWLAGNPNSVAQPPSISSGYYDWYRVDNERVRPSHTTYATAAQRDELIAWIGAQSEPWFAWFAPNAAHAPYDPPPGTRSTGSERGDYLQVLAYLDQALVEVLAAVDLDDTLVLVFGDNGTPDGARPLGTPSGFWKGTTHEGGIRVPLLVAGPGVRQGASSRLVSALDLGPTILEILGTPSRGFEDGRSFADELGEWRGAAARTWLFSERYDTPGGVQPEGYDDMAFVEGPTVYPGTETKVLLKRRLVDADGIGPGGRVDLLYDLASDPDERAPGPFSSAPSVIRNRFAQYAAALPAR